MAEVVALPTAQSAAAGRAAGWDVVQRRWPSVTFVQFVDGDCVLDADWCSAAIAHLDANLSLAAVWGWRREVDPDRNVYERICEREWRTPPAGPTRHFGGDVMIRATAYAAAGGYDPTVVASEDHELSLRVCAAGWKIERLDRQMTTHDASLSHIGQWYRRAVRRGVGLAQVWYRHRHRREGVEIARAVTWGFAVPVAIGAATAFVPAAGLFALAYPLRAARVAWCDRHAGWRYATAWGVHCVAAALPNAIGAVRQLVREHRGVAGRVIDYRTDRRETSRPRTP
jgi:hypothetical protein